MQQRRGAEIRIDQRRDATDLTQGYPNARVLDGIIEHERNDIAVRIAFGEEVVRQLIC